MHTFLLHKVFLGTFIFWGRSQEDHLNLQSINFIPIIELQFRGSLPAPKKIPVLSSSFRHAQTRVLCFIRSWVFSPVFMCEWLWVYSSMKFIDQHYFVGYFTGSPCAHCMVDLLYDDLIRIPVHPNYRARLYNKLAVWLACYMVLLACIDWNWQLFPFTSLVELHSTVLH